MFPFIPPGALYHVNGVRVLGLTSRMEFVNPCTLTPSKEVLEARDDSYPRGSVGLRVVDTHACFSDLKITSAGTSLRPGRSDG